MENKTNEEKAMRLVNGVITELLDPKVYYSRFSFLESGKEAIDKKHVINTKKTSNNLEKWWSEESIVSQSLSELRNDYCWVE